MAHVVCIGTRENIFFAQSLINLMHSFTNFNSEFMRTLRFLPVNFVPFLPVNFVPVCMKHFH